MSTLEMYEDARKRGKVIYHRNPTKAEIKFGMGAIHYAEFDREDCINPKTNQVKKWFVSPHDGLRYYH